jgi:hypothetical protein
MEPINFRDPARWNSINVPERVAARAYANADQQPDGCWVSRYSVSTHGYAQIGWSVPKEQRRGKAINEMVLAHRASWTHINGQVPLGMTLDHLCKNRRCVNPDHLRVLPNLENARRNQGDDFPIGGCRRGHGNDALIRIARRNKLGERRWGLTCGICIGISRTKWVLANPEKVRAAWKASNDRRKAS